MEPPVTPRILAMAFGCYPGEGSEGGAGWAWALLLAGIGPTTVLVRPWPGAREAITAALEQLPEASRPAMHYVDIPRWMRPFAGRGLTSRIEYVVWQWAALRAGRRLLADSAFDLAWHLSWANAWVGSTAAMLDLPFVYGPVGAGVGPPWRLVPGVGVIGGIAELARAASRWAGRWLNPLAKRSWEAADLILVQNPETRDWFPESVRERVVLMPNAVFVDPPDPRRPRPVGDPPTVLFAGRHVAWKGLDLAIEALALMPGWRLIACGDGDQTRRLQQLARRRGVAGRVEFRGWTDRNEVLRLMREEADVLVFPSLHDEGGWTVAEAVAMGLPVVCLDRGGPVALGGIPVRATTPRATAGRLAAALGAVAGRPSGPPPWSFDVETRRAEVRRLLQLRGVIASNEDGDQPIAAPSA
jgi:glycosyltransferase involved in cell wall biosynthesis